MDALTNQCNIGLLAAGAAAAKGNRGGIRSMATAASIKAVGIGIGIGVRISKSNCPNSSSFLRFSSSATATLLPLIRSLPPSSSSLSAAAPPEAHEETVVSATPTQSQSKTAHVKFVLQKACLFGERFFLVGDDPMLGLWDPSNAIPLEWSDGHLWTVEMDIPVGKSVQFKLLLRGLSGDVHWQPGPDRIVRIWATENTIVVAEDWKNADGQKITEQVPGDASAVISTDSMNEGVAECVPASNEPDAAGIVTDHDSLKLPHSLDHEMQISSMEGKPLLVPGLGPIPAVSASSSVFPHAVNGKAVDARLASDVAMDCHSSQSSSGRHAEKEAYHEEQAETEWSNTNPLAEETAALSKKPISSDTDTVASCHGMQKGDHESNSQSAADGVLRNDIRWGIKALNQLLLNLGFRVNLPAD